MLGRFCGSDPGEGVCCGGTTGCWTGRLFIGCFSAISARLSCVFVALGWEVACDAVDCCDEIVGLKLLLDVGVTGLVGWLVDEGSELPSLVRFFFKKPRVGIKKDVKRMEGRESRGSAEDKEVGNGGAARLIGRSRDCSQLPTSQRMRIKLRCGCGCGLRLRMRCRSAEVICRAEDKDRSRKTANV